MNVDEESQIPARSATVDAFWEEARIQPVEIALPRAFGLTLRHYRTIAADVAIEDEETGEEEETELTESQDDVAFISHKGHLLLFQEPQSLIDFLRSGSPHDLHTVDGFQELVSQLTPELLVIGEDDRYELDLVVENLRGGHDAWEPDLLISAAEIARDIAHACELSDVTAALAPGSPLDTIDEALRDGGFWARRRLKSVSSETAALTWRSIIGKIAAITTVS